MRFALLDQRPRDLALHRLDIRFSGVNKVKYWVMIFGFVCAFPALAQTCNDGIRQNAFLARYQIGTDPSIVEDLATGLFWQRCAVGLVFNDLDDADDFTASCDQPPENTDSDTSTSAQVTWNWYEAVERASQEGGGWRLPNNKELLSLVEFACHSPAINTGVFPGVLQSGYWTSTPNASTDSSAWSLSFGDGADDATDKNSALPIRLVRD